MKGSKIMNYCPKCKLNIEGERELCPLCQSVLDKNKTGGTEIFPEIKVEKKKKRFLALKILLLISAIVVIASSTVNAILSTTGHWALYVISGIACAWFVSTIILLQRKNVLKTIFSQTVVVIVLTFIWDCATGLHGWATNFVIPITVFLATISTAVISEAMRIPVEDYSVYLCNLALVNCLLILLLVFDIVSIRVPTTICIGMNFLIITVFAIFEGKKIWGDIKRRLHI